MANQNAKIDSNSKRTLLGVSDDANAEIRRLLVDTATGRLLISATITGGAIISLNGLNAGTQLFATGTTGTDFNIVSAVATHTFNIPTASAANRGLLSNTNWSDFNSKQPGSASLTSLAGLVFASTSFVKMTAANTFGLDTTTYATSTLNNLGTTDVNSDLKYKVNNNSTYYFGTKDATTAATGGDNLYIIAGNGLGVAVGGTITIKAGEGGLTTTGGAGAGILIQGGSAHGTGANDGGNVELVPGAKTGLGANGVVYIEDPTSGQKAIFNTASIATTNKTYTFPNRSITFDNITTSTTTNGTGFLKGNGTVISFDNSTYLTSSIYPITIGNGGTGQTTKATAFDALSPMSTAGDIIYGGALGTGSRLGIGGANTVLHGGVSVPAYSAVVEADITLTAGNTVNNTKVGTHGFAPALSGINTQFLRGDGAWAAPGATTVPNAYISETFTYTANTPHNIVHSFGTFPVVQAFDNTGSMLVPLVVQNTDVNTVAITFLVGGDFTLVLTIGSPPLTAYTSTSGNYNMLAGDYLIEETGSGKIVTLLTPVGRSGKQVIIKNSSAGVCDVQTAAGLIDGIADVTLASGDSLSVCSNNTNWLVI